MARPKKQTVDYFPHYCNSGKTIYILESQFGNNGYAFWFKLLELLSKSEGHFYDCNNPAVWQFLLAKTHVTAEIADSIFAVLCDLDAIDKELWSSRVVWCQNLVNNVSDVYRHRGALIPLKPSYSKQEHRVIQVSATSNPTDTEVSVSRNPQSKVKYSKVNNIGKKKVEKATGLEIRR